MRARVQCGRAERVARLSAGVSYGRGVGGSTWVMGDDFERLVEEVRPRLIRAFSAAYGLGRGEEALAESMAYAWEHRQELTGMANPAGYLFRVGQSRSRSRRAPVTLPHPAELGLPHIEPGLAPALAELSERQRACIALVVAHHWTHQEVAELLGISKGSVQTHVDRALAHLRTRLGVNDELST